jgi:hypothetical protein
MAIYTGDLLSIGGTPITELVSYKVNRAKLWKDADRNMNGDVRATLIGVFPKIELEIGVTTQDRLNALATLFDAPYFSVTYFDNQSGTTVTANYYAGDYSPELLSKPRGLWKPFSINLIPVSKV